MLYTVLGISFKKGNFKDKSTGETKPYDNVIFHCCFEPIDEFTEGKSVSDIKIKRKFLKLSDGELIKKIGSDCDFELTPYGNSFVYTGVRFLS